MSISNRHTHPALQRIAEPRLPESAVVMCQPRVPDDPWEDIKPLLLRERPKPRGGRPPIPDRAVRDGIIFLLHTDTPWRLRPQELGCGCGSRASRQAVR